MQASGGKTLLIQQHNLLGQGPHLPERSTQFSRSATQDFHRPQIPSWKPPRATSLPALNGFLLFGVPGGEPLRGILTLNPCLRPSVTHVTSSDTFQERQKLKEKHTYLHSLHLKPMNICFWQKSHWVILNVLVNLERKEIECQTGKSNISSGSSNNTQKQLSCETQFTHSKENIYNALLDWTTRLTVLHLHHFWMSTERSKGRVQNTKEKACQVHCVLCESLFVSVSIIVNHNRNLSESSSVKHTMHDGMLPPGTCEQVQVIIMGNSWNTRRTKCQTEVKQVIKCHYTCFLMG